MGATIAGPLVAIAIFFWPAENAHSLPATTQSLSLANSSIAGSTINSLNGSGILVAAPGSGQTNINTGSGPQTNIATQNNHFDPSYTSPETAQVLLGRWTGTYICPRDEGRLDWTVNYLGGHIVIAETSTRDLGHFAKLFQRFVKVQPPSEDYEVTWASPTLQIRATGNYKYTAILTLMNDNYLTGRYYNHLGCSAISLRKLSN